MHHCVVLNRESIEVYFSFLEDMKIILSISWLLQSTIYASIQLVVNFFYVSLSRLRASLASQVGRLISDGLAGDYSYVVMIGQINARICPLACLCFTPPCFINPDFIAAQHHISTHPKGGLITSEAQSQSRRDG